VKYSEILRSTYVYRDGELVEKRLAPPLVSSTRRSHLGFNFISDKLWDVQGQHDGRIYDSKSELRRSYREQGLAELGNDVSRETPSPARSPSGPDVIEAYQKVRDGYKPRIEQLASLEELPGSEGEFDFAEAGAEERQETD
jgi:predicted heme/steroid binding protein